MKRRTAREKAIQTLYQVDVTKNDWHEALSNVLETEELTPFLEERVAGVMEHMEEIDEIIRRCLHNWRLERLSHVDRAILRLAVYELTFQIEIPKGVIINEAVELAKTFGGEQSSKFINGVLSNVVEQGELDDGSFRD